MLESCSSEMVLDALIMQSLSPKHFVVCLPGNVVHNVHLMSPLDRESLKQAFMCTPLKPMKCFLVNATGVSREGHSMAFESMVIGM